MEIYADLYFLANASMDLAALFAAGSLLRMPLRPARLFAGALLGGGYALLALLLPGGWWQLPAAAAAGLLLCRVSYRTRTVRQYFLASLLFFSLSLLLGGIVTAVCTLLGAGGILPPAGSGGSILYPAALLLALLCRRLGRGLHRDTACHTAKAELTLLDKTLTVEGLLDTGNLLREPFGGRAVVILSEDAAEALLPAGVNTRMLLREQDELPRALRSRLRMLPIRTVGGRRLLPGLLCDKAVIDGKELPVCLGIDPGKKRYGGMKALLPAMK